MSNNQVENPSHYNSGKIEVIDFIEDQNLNFNLGNAVKYISRAGKKDPKIARYKLRYFFFLKITIRLKSIGFSDSQPLAFPCINMVVTIWNIYKLKDVNI